MDYRIEFTKWWVNEFKTIKFPSVGTVFDYYIDTETKKVREIERAVLGFLFEY